MKTEKGWKFTDLYTFQVISHSIEDFAQLKDDYMGAFKPPVPGITHPTGLGNTSTNASTEVQPKTGLVIKIAATHAGLITRNNGFYLPDRMRAGIGTWTEHYNKPIGLHHHPDKDPVGRVIGARYVDTSGPVIDQLKNKVQNIQYLFQDLISDRTSFIKKVNTIQLLDSVLQDPHYQGVGYSELTANITDPEAIQKVLDGRYITGSIEATSDKAVCSVCGVDFLDAVEICEHRPGRVYDGKKAFIIAGNLNYDGWDFVNTPADRHSSILQIQNSIKDSTLKYFPIFLEDSMSDQTAPSSNVEPTVETPIVTETKQDSTIVPPVETPVKTTLPETESSELDTILDKLFSDISITDEESEKLYLFQVEEMDKNIVTDAKLSTASRNKLPSSTFCGPKGSKSFPVNDKPHYLAALRLLSRYKGPGDKSTIKACILRKGRANGWTSEQDSIVKDNTEIPVVIASIESPEETITFTSSYKGELTDTVKAETVKSFIDQLINQFNKDLLIAELTNMGFVLSHAERSSLQDSITSLETEVTRQEEIVGDLRDQLSLLRRELRAAYDDVTIVEDQLIKSQEKIRSGKLDKLHMLHTIEGTLTDQVKQSFNQLSDESLDNSITSISTKVDIQKITDKLNSGISKTPDEIIEVPVGLTEPATETKPINQPTFQSQRDVDDVYRKLYLSDGHVKATTFYHEMVKRGLAAPRLDK